MTPELTRYRLRIIAIIGVSLFVALFIRLWFVQVVAAEEAQAQAESQIIRVVREQGPRGRILDKNGKVLVENRLTNVVEIDREKLNAGSPRDDDSTEDVNERVEFQRQMFTRLALEINGSGPSELIKVSDLVNAKDDLNYSNLEKVPVAWDVSDGLLVLVGERADIFPGVTVSERSVRYYPYGQYAAHILGWVGRIGSEWESIKPPSIDDPDYVEDLSQKPYLKRDEIGKEGIERLFESELRGVPGQRRYEVDARGRVVREFEDERQFPEPGNDVWLTIDIDLQARAEDELAAALANAQAQEPDDPADPEFKATGGAAVIMDPRTGQIRAMASNPTFDISEFVGGIPQDRYEALLALNNPFVNRAITGQYAPGSTFKPFVAIAAYEHDLFGSETYIPEMDQFITHDGLYTAQSCQIKATDDEGVEGQQSAGCLFKNAGKEYVDINLETSLTASSDDYYYQIGEGFWINTNDDDDNAIQDTSEQFGFGTATGIELPSESRGYVPTPERRQERHNNQPEIFPNPDWRSGDNITLAIGQNDLTVTPLQLANAYAALANGGTMFNPNIVASVRESGLTAEDGEGEVLLKFEPRIAYEFEIPEEVATRILAGLLAVPTKDDVFLSDGARLQNGGTAFQAFAEIEFPHDKWPVAGKTGTSERDNQADNALFAGYGPVDLRTNLGPEQTRRLPSRVGVAVLEEAGFGSRSAAPLIAKLFRAIALGEVGQARTADEVREAFFAENSFAGLEGVTNDGQVDLEELDEGLDEEVEIGPGGQGAELAVEEPDLSDPGEAGEGGDGEPQQGDAEVEDPLATKDPEESDDSREGADS